MSDRTKVWDTTYGRDLGDELIANGYGDLVRASEAYLQVDGDAMRETALTVYGTGFQHNSRNASPKTPAKDADHELPEQGTGGNAFAPIELRKMEERASKRFSMEVWLEWAGDAAEQTAVRIGALSKVTLDEADRIEMIGERLWEMARDLDDNRIQTEDAVTGAATLLKTIKGYVDNPKGWFQAAKDTTQFVSKCAWTVNDILADGEKRFHEAKGHVDEYISAGKDLASEKVLGQRPSEYFAFLPVSKDVDAWKPRD